MTKSLKKTTEKKANAFVLVEILFALSIFVAIMLVLTMFSRNVWFYNSFLSAGLSEIQVARQALKIMTAEIRTAAAAETGAYMINLANATTFTFYSDIDDDGLTERIRYFLSGSNLQKGVTEPSGSPSTYNLANETISTLVSKVTNATIFSYYDENYDGTTPPLPLPPNVALIRLIKINITIDQDPNRPPAGTTIETQISIRNLKDNL